MRLIAMIATLLSVACAGPLALSQPSRQGVVDRPDVLFITVDDMNNWITLLNSDAPIKTPNLERLAKRGTLFTQAHCASPSCNPSRTATLTGLRPTTTGVYRNNSDWRRAVPDRPTIMQRFMEGGYEVCGAGKIFHHLKRGAFHDDASFEDFQPMAAQSYPPQKLGGLPGYGSRNTDWGAWPINENESIDYQTVTYCINALGRPAGDRPRFLACGIYRPHSPFYAPASYHTPYEDIPLPPRIESDWDDLPSGAETLMKSTSWFWRGMVKNEETRPGSYHRFIQAYAACVAYADAQVGRLLDALDQSPRRNQTIIVFWSDHGFHLGEKNHIEKFGLWQKTTHIPFIVVAPGVAEPGSRCSAPVDMTVIYPTLLALCGLPEDPQADGVSIVPLLKNPWASWDRPAIMTYLPGNHAVRSERWRYIRYQDGSEELYDHTTDPNEWYNLAGDPRLSEVLAEHRLWLPENEAPVIPDLGKD